MRFRHLALIGAALFVAVIVSTTPRATRSAQEKEGQMESATFGAGCFWGVEAAFRALPGVVSTRVGYAGGTVANPTYEQVCSRATGHTEAVEVTFDPTRISYEELLTVFFRIHDPAERSKLQYRSVIFFHTPAQHAQALAALARVAQRSNTHPVTTVLPAPTFYPAEEYHQQYYQKRGITPTCSIRTNGGADGVCGTINTEATSGVDPAQPEAMLQLYSVDRDAYIELLPITITELEWQQILSGPAYDVARRSGTERPFANAYWDHHASGIYRCVGCGTDLFTSAAKFDSGTGWPSFWTPVALDNISTQTDTGQGMVRTEFRYRRCGGHLGHVFTDGPKPTGLRYCTNSTALTFVARATVPARHERGE